MFSINDKELNLPVLLTVFASLPFPSSLLIGNNEDTEHLIQGSVLGMQVHIVCGIVKPVIVLCPAGSEAA